jgi:S1-C subfamily serine protease/poly(3-hydroxybutyrate) depolymerase
MSRRPLFLAALAAAALLAPQARAQTLDQLQQKAIQDAVKKIAPCVVKIETSGGTEVVKAGPKGMIRRGIGPTTGVIVSPDGYVISSAFNFANNPTTIRVTLPGTKGRKVARVVATDQTRMLTLLKIVDLAPGTTLPVPEIVPTADRRIGYTAIAIGRTLSLDVEGMPSVSVGIISALERIWGKVLQTDAKVSPTNYGGPLIDLYGRVYGILVPASPQAEGELAGFEWYDSGIGFAVPLSDVNAVLPRLKAGTEASPVVLRRGFLGITMRSPDMYGAEPVIGTIQPGSAAEKAGVKVGDRIQKIDGKAVINYAQVLHKLGSKYEGDTVSLELVRGKDTVALDKVVLGSSVAAFGQPYFGILPLRDDPAPGVEVRYVYPKGPADAAGIKAGDRIMKIGPAAAKAVLRPITGGRDQLISLLETARPGIDVRVEVKRKAGGASQVLTVKLAQLPLDDSVPKKLPERASAKKALTKPGGKGPKVEKKEAKKAETGFLERKPAADPRYWIYVPDTYDPNVACAVVVWLHPAGKNKEKDIEDFVSSWQNYCDEQNIILVCPTTESPRGWTPGDSDYVQRAVRAVMDNYTVDRRRVVAHGMSVGGEMAFFLGFQARPLIRGVAVVAASLGSNPRERITNQPLAFFLAVGAKDPLLKGVTAAKERLTRHKYPVVHREVANMGHEYIDGRTGTPTLEELIRWIDSLDRM